MRSWLKVFFVVGIITFSSNIINEIKQGEIEWKIRNQIFNL